MSFNINTDRHPIGTEMRYCMSKDIINYLPEDEWAQKNGVLDLIKALCAYQKDLNRENKLDLRERDISEIRPNDLREPVMWGINDDTQIVVLFKCQDRKGLQRVVGITATADGLYWNHVGGLPFGAQLKGPPYRSFNDPRDFVNQGLETLLATGEYTLNGDTVRLL